MTLTFSATDDSKNPSICEVHHLANSEVDLLVTLQEGAQRFNI